MIEIKNLSKTFRIKDGLVKALEDVSLSINDGERYGVIGYSGAGKSTLVRCINFLEMPDSGSVSIDGKTMEIENGVLYSVNAGEKKKMSEKELNRMRSSIGMIFQHFNLLTSRTVYQNIAFPLEIQGMSKAEIEEVRKRSPSVSKGKSSPWDTDYIEMAKKTLIRRAFKAVPKTGLSDDKLKSITAAVDYDEKVEREWVRRKDAENAQKGGFYGDAATQADNAPFVTLSRLCRLILTNPSGDGKN